jgi:hypothetical protein
MRAADRIHKLSVIIARCCDRRKLVLDLLIRLNKLDLQSTTERLAKLLARNRVRRANCIASFYLTSPSSRIVS